MINKTMTQVVAKPYRVFFFVYSFFKLFLQERERPVYFVWNYILDTVKIKNFHCNNIIYAKNKKEEKTYNINLYLNPLVRRNLKCGKKI